MRSRKTVLVPLDGSALAEAALPYAVAVAEARHGSIELLCIVETDDEGLVGASSSDVLDYITRVRLEGMEEFLKVAARGIEEQGIPVTTRITTGNAADEIVATAENTRASMVVMSTHGRGGLDRWLIGSVADKVMRLSTCPTLLVQAAAEEPPRATKRVTFKRLIVPLDGSSLAERALKPAAELARETGAELILVRVESWFPSWLAGDMVPYPVGIDEAMGQAAEDYLAHVRNRLSAGVQTSAHVMRGVASDSLAVFAHENAIDLIVMTTHGRGGLRRLVMGSVADRLVRSETPVLLIKPRPVRSRQATSKRHSSPTQATAAPRT